MSPMAEPRWLSEEEQRTWRAFLFSTKLLHATFERDLRQNAGIPHNYYEILVRLSEAPDHTMRMSELAASSNAPRSRLSHAVARLEEAGWVKREVLASDRRGALAVLTDKGYAALEAAAPAHVESVRTHLFDQLTPAQLDQLRDISEAILAHLSSIGVDEAACDEVLDADCADTEPC